MAKQRHRRLRNQIPHWLWLGLACVVAMAVLSVKVSLECLERRRTKAFTFAPTSWVEHLLVMVHPDLVAFVNFTSDLRKHIQSECIVWEPSYRPGHSRTTLSCHVNPAGDIPEKLYAWAMAHRFHMVILSRPENLHPQELAYLDEMMRVLGGMGAYGQSAAQRDVALAQFEEMARRVSTQ